MTSDEIIATSNRAFVNASCSRPFVPRDEVVFGVDVDIIWEIVTTKVPLLLAAVQLELGH